MLENLKNQDSDVQIADRRSHARVYVRSLAYIELDQDNGGLILNISESGVAVQSAEIVVGNHFERVRFRLPKSDKWIEASGKLVWIGKTRKEAGIRFVDLDNDALQQIRRWVCSAAFRPGLPVEQGGFKIVWEVEDPDAASSEPAGETEPTEFDSMFPSEKSLSPETFPGLNKPATLDSRPPGDRAKRSKADSTASPPRSYELPLMRPVTRSEKHTEPVKPRPEQIERPSAQIKQRSEPIGQSLEEAEQGVKQTPPQPDARRSPDIGRLRAAFAKSNPVESATTAPKREPFAAGVANQTTDSGAPSFSSGPTRAEGPAFPPQPIDFTGFGYQPPAFEEPSGKGWLIAGAVLVALLGFGTALALGPANVKGIFFRHFSWHALSSEGPPPPANASEKAPADASAADTPRAASSPMPFDGSSQQSILNPGVEPAAGGEGPKASSSSRPSRIGKGRAPDSGEIDVASSPAKIETGAPGAEETPEVAEAKTRQFQMEHSQLSGAAGAVPPAVADSRTPRQVPSTAPLATPGAAASTPNERTMDAYAEPVPARSHSSGTAAATAGTVAISSHFHSIRGQESLAAPPERALQIGQLTSIHPPEYSAEAERAHVEGTVQLRATVDQIGRVEIVHVLSGPAMLVPAAVEAVRQWRYGPTILDGRAVEGVNDISVVFRLSNAASSPR
jgi:TonB family protein